MTQHPDHDAYLHWKETDAGMQVQEWLVKGMTFIALQMAFKAGWHTCREAMTTLSSPIDKEES